MAKVYGKIISEHGACKHYSSHLDVIAIKFKCCNRYYACHACHHEIADHPTIRWEISEFDTKAILCRRCRFIMSIYEYIFSENVCKNCQSALNPGCKQHWQFYFAIPGSK